MDQKIEFKDLNLLLKIAVIGGLISFIVNVIGFIVGFAFGAGL